MADLNNQSCINRGLEACEQHVAPSVDLFLSVCPVVSLKD